MTKLEKIEQEVATLSPPELARFREWFEAHEAALFDHRIGEDATSGRLDTLADAALASHQAGKTRSL